MHKGKMSLRKKRPADRQMGHCFPHGSSNGTIRRIDMPAIARAGQIGSSFSVSRLSKFATIRSHASGLFGSTA